MIKLGAKQLRTTKPFSKDLAKIKRNPIYIILDNVLDTYNVGSIFRLADAVAAKKIYLCGETETPPNPRIKKASIDTWKWVPWQYARTAKEAVLKLRNLKWEDRSRKENLTSNFKNPASHFSLRTSIIAIEQHPQSIPYDEAKYEFPLAVVVGNETYGVNKEVLDIADQIVEIPLWGVNKSLNVMVSLGIVLYEIMRQNYFFATRYKSMMAMSKIPPVA